ncbi:MAG TPA: ABC transporter permease subunit, partial [Sphaerochaeta sp.]|nr:ABC transporter permease subunit [Sphaerochaeta sp.]
MKRTNEFDFWVTVSLFIFALYMLFMVYPLFMVISKSVVSAETGKFTLKYFKQFFSQQYYYMTLTNSFKVALSVSIVSLAIGIPLAYLYNMYETKGAKTLQMLIILSSMSAPFIGAYAWILLLGRAGVITKFLKATFGISVPTIYGFPGIVLVLSLKLFPLVFLYVSGALKNLDNSLLEASQGMGRSGFKRFATVVLPLCMPSILAAALMVFMRALADFGTPLMIGEGYMTFPVIIYNQFVGEVGTNQNFAASISVIAIIITMIFFLVQKYMSTRHSFSISAMNPIERKKPTAIGSFFIHLFAYGVVACSLLPQLYLVYLSFRKTSSAGIVFLKGYSLKSYQQVFSNMGGTIWNTIRICGMALIVIVF